MFREKFKKLLFSDSALAALVIIFVFSVIFRLNIIENIFNSSEITFSKPDLTQVGPILSPSVPTRLRIPKLNINTTFVEPLGLSEGGEISVPDSDEEVGWYKYSPTPGEYGPSIILGHVDSYTGPAVFFYLGQLKPGDDVFVDREDGTTAHFQVSSLERPKQSEFPTDRVYGNIDHAGLRLITCSGIYIKGKQRYTNNLVVYARSVE